jgi:hypothetical protein
MVRKIAVVALLAMLALVVAVAVAEQWVPLHYSRTPGSAAFNVSIGTGWRWLNVSVPEADFVTVSGWSGVSRVMPASGTSTDTVWTVRAGCPIVVDLNGATRLRWKVGSYPADSIVINAALGR